MVEQSSQERDRFIGELVAGARRGDRECWDRLVEQHLGLLWSVARSYRLREADAADAVQVTWLRLLEHIDRIKDPARVGAWLTTTLRRECLRLLAYNARVQVAEESDLERQSTGPEILADLIARETTGELSRAIDTLPPRWRALMLMMLEDPQPSYADISRALAIPIGSIGPTRGRCVERLRAELGM